MANVTYAITSDKLVLIVTTTQDGGQVSKQTYLPEQLTKQLAQVQAQLTTQTADLNARITSLQTLVTEYNTLAATAQPVV
jgi:sensor domain CHASE-containing protein